MELFKELELNNHILLLVKNIDLSIQLKNPRKTRLGDYHFDPRDKQHKITINNNLETYSKFFVLTHELAHMFAYIQYGKAIQSHGKEWKLVFANLLLDSMDLYPENWHRQIIEHSKRPFANLLHDNALANLLIPNKQQNGKQLIQLCLGDDFEIKQMRFKVLEKKRKRYLCLNIEDKKKYWVHQNSWVTPL